VRFEDTIRMAHSTCDSQFIQMTKPSPARNSRPIAADGVVWGKVKEESLLHRNGYGTAQACSIMTDACFNTAEKVYGSGRHRTRF